MYIVVLGLSEAVQRNDVMVLGLSEAVQRNDVMVLGLSEAVQRNAIDDLLNQGRIEPPNIPAVGRYALDSTNKTR